MGHRRNQVKARKFRHGVVEPFFPRNVSVIMLLLFGNDFVHFFCSFQLGIESLFLFCSFRLGTKEILGSSTESSSPLKFFPTSPITQLRHESETLNSGPEKTCCPQCMHKYEQELHKLMNEESEKSSSGVKTDSNHALLPHWLQKAKADAPNAESIDSKQVT